MRFTETNLTGAFTIDLERNEDDRGFFARSFCRREFAEHGLNTDIVQCNVSVNHKRGTLRGLHYQLSPHQEAKLVRCVSGEIYDVIVDLRSDSPTFHGWHAVTLSARVGTALYVPEGMAHGFLSLTDDVEVLYQMTEAYFPELARGIRWDDPAIAIEWPYPPRMISQRDASFALIAPSLNA